jgi:hypothetical protein
MKGEAHRSAHPCADRRASRESHHSTGRLRFAEEIGLQTVSDLRRPAATPLRHSLLMIVIVPLFGEPLR